MADRLSRYPLLPDYNPALLQQQQHIYPPSQQQSQSDPSSSGQGNFDARMWTHMQQFNRTQANNDMPQPNVPQKASNVIVILPSWFRSDLGVQLLDAH
jgi:hypothetical protein